MPVSEPPPVSPAIPTSAMEEEATVAAAAEGAAPETAVTTGARRMPPQTKCKTEAVPPVGEYVGGSVGGSGMASTTVQPNGRGVGNAKDDLMAGIVDGPAAVSRITQPEVEVFGGIRPHVEESDIATAKPEEPPTVAAAAGENDVGRSSQWGEGSAATPGQQDTIPAGLLWSDFGGGREAGEDAEETASREFAEESFGIFHGVRLDSDSVARSQVSFVGVAGGCYLVYAYSSGVGSFVLRYMHNYCSFILQRGGERRRRLVKGAASLYCSSCISVMFHVGWSTAVPFSHSSSRGAVSYWELSSSFFFLPLVRYSGLSAFFDLREPGTYDSPV